ncbi:hypothetical protein OAU36_03530, partial [Gammaproteobacteria bacterium]|nr:hypothetical protein [Gammaproteobacteria bacterium]
MRKGQYDQSREPRALAESERLMFSLPDNWEMASLLAKLLLYFAAFSIAGGSLAALRYSNGSRATLFSNFSTVFVGAVV